MRTFAYRAYRPDGSEVSGFLQAASTKDAARQLSKEGARPFQIQPAGGARVLSEPTRKWRLVDPKPIDLARLFSDIALLLDAGFTIDGALQAVVASETNRERQAQLQSALDAITAGQPAAEGFALLPGIPADAIALIQAGERSAKLSTVCRRLSDNFAAQAKRKRAVWEAMSYPLFLLVVMAAALIVLALVLVPALEPIFDAPGASKPLTLKVLSHLNRILVESPYLLPLGLLLPLGFTIVASRSPGFRKSFMTIVLGMPLIGGLIRDSTGARYLGTLGLLLGSGVPLMEALRLAASTPSGPFSDQLGGVEERVATGARLDGALVATTIFGSATTSLITLGENANALPAVLERASHMIQASVDRRLDAALRVLTPALTIAMGLAVGSLVISVMTTILSINDLALQ